MAGDLRGGVHRLFEAGPVAAQPTRQLLDRFVVYRDEVAFEAIVARHGPMVAGVCRSILADPTDVDDAFQATFLVLVRRAGTLRDGDQLGPWLHGVARRVALQARGDSARRRARRQAGGELEPVALDPSLRSAEDRELAALLHAELDRLAPLERSAVLLCDLEGLTHQEAADQLGWPLGTVKTRVTRGRDRLRGRLKRRGVALSTAALATTLATEAASAAVARSVLVATTRAALAVVAGRALAVGLVSPTVLSLTRGTVRAMTFTKLKVGAIALVATTTALAVPPLVAYQQPARPEPPVATPEVARPQPKAEYAALSVQTIMGAGSPNGMRIRLAANAVDKLDALDRDKSEVPDAQRYLWYRRLAEAEYEGASNREGRIHAVKAYADRLETFINLKSATIKPNINEQSDEVWDRATLMDQELLQARDWLAMVQAASDGTAPAPKAALPRKVASPVASTPEEKPRWQVRIKPNPEDEQKNLSILAKLEERISINFPNDTPISDIQKYVEQATQDAAHGLPNGIPIYVEPKSLQAVDKTMASTAAINLEGIPLRTTLTLILNQLDLRYVVEGGVLIIQSVAPDQRQPVPNLVPTGSPGQPGAILTPHRGGGGRQ